MKLLDDLQRYPITALLCIGAIAAFIAGETGRSLEHLMLLPGTEFTEPWRFITAVFPHGGLIHVGFNVYWIWVLGRPLEERLGTLWTLGLVVLASFVGAGLEVAMLHNAIGLSGVVYAFAAFLYTRGRRDPRYAGIVPDDLVRFFVVWFFLCIVLTQLGVLRIANAAHFGGAAVGFALGRPVRWLAPVLVVVTGLAILFLQPRIPGWTGNNRGLQVQAFQALDRGDEAAAIGLYERAIEAGDIRSGSWKNYGIALNSVGRLNDALEAWERAHAMDPQTFEPAVWADIQRMLDERRAAPR
ncbi:MAG: rhomboid family intramembrane serine protease [Planctomycetota bacterium]